MANQKSQIKAGVILSYITIAAQVVINLVCTPITLRILGQNEYGLYSTAVSTISTLSILSLGFSSTYIKKYSEYKSRNDDFALTGLNGLYLVIFSIIGTIALCCGLFLSLNLQKIYGTGLTSQELAKAKVLMLLLTFNLSINFPLSVFNSIIGAHERFIFQKIVYMLKTIVSPIMMVPVLLLGYGSIGMVITTVSFALLSDAINIYYCIYKLEVKFRFHSWEPGVFKELFKYTAFIAINLVVDQINWNIDKVIIGRYRGTANVAVYSVGHTIHACYSTLAQSISNIFTPKVHAIANKYDHDIKRCGREFSGLFTRVGRVQFLVLALICSGFIIFGNTFIRLWAGDGYENSYFVCLLLMLPSSIVYVQTLGIEIQRSLNKHQFRSIFYLGMAICNLILSIFLCKRWGEIGSALGTCIALILADGITMNIFYQRVLKIDVISFWKTLIKMLPGLSFALLFGLLYRHFVLSNSWISLGIGVVIYSALYALGMYLISMDAYEKGLVTSTLTRVRNTIRRG